MRRALVFFARNARLLLAALALGGADPARAAGENCAPSAGDAPLHIASIGKNLDLMLDDGRVLTLPTLNEPRANAQNFPALAREKWRHALEGAKGRDIGPPDRWGRYPALIFAADGRGLDEILLAEGLAMLAANPGPCAAAARAAEASARAQKIGIWGDPELGLVDEAHFGDLRAREGALTLIEAKILSVGQGRGKIFLNLGKRFHAPTLVVYKKHEAEFAKAGLDLDHLAGRKILARGVVDFRAAGDGEALIELFHPAQIDVMDEGRSANP